MARFMYEKLSDYQFVRFDLDKGIIVEYIPCKDFESWDYKVQTWIIIRNKHWRITFTRFWSLEQQTIQADEMMATTRDYFRIIWQSLD